MSDGLEVDVAVVTDAGARLLRSAEVLRQQAAATARLEFGGAHAGRDYAAKGDAVRDALGVVGVALGQWAADAESFGHAFRAAAARYSGTDANTTAVVSGVQW
ncbi:excreted virulence factor EspC (type VII ESX diderm) [Rhodococcus wratislaviensis]|uniref:Excreted virulence factor EspC (Type VII ESX diderm) n=1 Tax=Rhodococcus wratislaviensis TaxID=44752 RepID=A0AB38FNQ5_RHOWR|nr:type VII secretion target [Rhodococcus wratislaviensis]REE72251.1 excreted virulence factor EspC (type VII ESX diderm) [Rhodococcus wratislaviensis]SPZ43104.1 Uncharacterised protein [Rhodococcus wratislaviensis]